MPQVGVGPEADFHLRFVGTRSVTVPPAPTPAPVSRRSLAGTLSVLLHVGVLLGFTFLPERPQPAPALDLRTIELLPPDFDPAPPKASPPVPEPEPVPPPPEVEPEIEPIPPTSEPTPPDAPAEDAPAATPEPAPTPVPDTPAAPAESPAPATTEREDQPQGLSLSLRGHRESDAPGSPLSPRVRWTPTGPSGGALHGGVPDGPQPQDRPKPRSLDEAGFLQRRNGNIVYRDPLKRFNATLHPDGRVTFRNRIGNPFTTGMPGLHEGIREASGEELYRDAKNKLLDETQELREAYAMRNATQSIDHQLRSLEYQLREIWHEVAMSAQDRRKLLFERWDECEEGQSKPSDGAGTELEVARQEAGDRARRMIEAFIRRTLPQGSPDAFSDDELRAFNARRTSAQRFSPYRAG